MDITPYENENNHLNNYLFFSEFLLDGNTLTNVKSKEIPNLISLNNLNNLIIGKYYIGYLTDVDNNIDKYILGNFFYKIFNKDPYKYLVYLGKLTNNNNNKILNFENGFSINKGLTIKIINTEIEISEKLYFQLFDLNSFKPELLFNEMLKNRIVYNKKELPKLLNSNNININTFTSILDLYSLIQEEKENDSKLKSSGFYVHYNKKENDYNEETINDDNYLYIKINNDEYVNIIGFVKKKTDKIVEFQVNPNIESKIASGSKTFNIDYEGRFQSYENFIQDIVGRNFINIDYNDFIYKRKFIIASIFYRLNKVRYLLKDNFNTQSLNDKKILDLIDLVQNDKDNIKNTVKIEELQNDIKNTVNIDLVKNDKDNIKNETVKIEEVQNDKDTDKDTYKDIKNEANYDRSVPYVPKPNRPVTKRLKQPLKGGGRTNKKRKNKRSKTSKKNIKSKRYIKYVTFRTRYKRSRKIDTQLLQRK
jgi:hypothetical protein